MKRQAFVVGLVTCLPLWSAYQARGVGEGVKKLSRQASARIDAPPLRMFVQITIVAPELLPETVSHTQQIIGMDVCGDAIQDWVTV